jgi:hypothetical protein
LVKKGDIVLISLLLILCVIGLVVPAAQKDNSDTVIVTAGGSIHGEYPLGEDREITVSYGGHTCVIAVEEGNVRMKAADCEDKLCVKQGAVHSHNEIIVCLPSQITVYIGKSGADDGGMDTIAY